MKRKYEIMYILDQDVKEPQPVIDKFNKIITNEGEIIVSEDWGMMDFAYEINHKKKGYYIVLIAHTTAQAIDEFKRVAGIDKNVVRSLVLNTENLKNYAQTTKLSKTDMTKFDEERRENKKPNFRKNFNKDFKRDFNKDKDLKDNKEAKVSKPRVETKDKETSEKK